ncbi:MAG: hypothetical protein IKY07_04480, partial [Clostridia bacterium]|nr:hypothetical protein [Clostridia bacterium]
MNRLLILRRVPRAILFSSYFRKFSCFSGENHISRRLIISRGPVYFPPSELFFQSPAYFPPPAIFPGRNIISSRLKNHSKTG